MDILSDVKIFGDLVSSSIGLTNDGTNGVRFIITDEAVNTVHLTTFGEKEHERSNLVVENFCVSDNLNLLQFSSDGIRFGEGYYLSMDYDGMKLTYGCKIISTFEPYKPNITDVSVPAECMRFFLVEDNRAHYTNISVWDMDNCKKVEMDITLICGQGIVGEISSPFGNNKRLVVVYDNFS